MDISSMIPLEIRNEAKVFFDGQTLMQTQKLMDNSRISISFQKGGPERFFIISGIISDGSTYETKVTFKKNETYPQGNINSSCNCHLWNESNHCPHVAALYVRFLVSHALKEQPAIDNAIRPELSLRGHGVHAHHYGRIVNAANALNGARSNSTYSSLQYILTNRKVVNFPLSQSLKGKIILNLVAATTLEDFRDYPGIEGKFYPTFSHQLDENINHKVSVFETLYLFDWNSGAAYNVPADIQHLLKTFRNEGYINEFMLKKAL